MSNLYKGLSIETYYQASFDLAEGFQRRILKCEKTKDDGRRTTDDRRQVMAKVQITFGNVRLKSIFVTNMDKMNNF
jgi:hypothetical protein